MFAREAREEDGAGKTSRPVSITVIIRDVNDNSPVLETIEDVVITAGKKRRKIAKVASVGSNIVISLNGVVWINYIIWDKSFP